MDEGRGEGKEGKGPGVPSFGLAASNSAWAFGRECYVPAARAPVAPGAVWLWDCDHITRVLLPSLLADSGTTHSGQGGPPIPRCPLGFTQAVASLASTLPSLLHSVGSGLTPWHTRMGSEGRAGNGELQAG